MEEAFN